MAPLHFKADRVGVIVMGIFEILACAIGIPTAAYIAGKAKTTLELAGAAAGGAVIAAVLAFYQWKNLSIESIELSDDEVVVCKRKQLYRYRWDAIRKVVQNFGPSEEWYIYTQEPRPVLVFSPQSLAHADIKKMRQFIKDRIGYESQTDPQYAAKASRA